MIADEALSQDGFLGGRLKVWQPRRGYRAGADAVLLAASVDACAGQSVLDVGCGTGVVALCLAARVPGLELWGLELQSDYAHLARRNGAENNVPLEVIEGDVMRMPAVLRERRFNHVVSNPPYFDPAAHTPPEDAGKAVAHQALRLGDWIGACARRVAPKGTLTLIQKTTALPAMLAALPASFGGVEVFPVAARDGDPAGRVILSARAGSRAAFKLHGPLVMHEGKGTGAAEGSLKSISVLRHGGGLR